MEQTQKDISDNLVISCVYAKRRGFEYFVPEHFLGIHLSGETNIQTNHNTFTFKEGSVILVRKNELFRSVKIPGSNGEYKAIVIFLNEDVLRKYATAHKIVEQQRYSGEYIKNIEPNSFITAYFHSLLPYAETQVNKSHSLSDIKIYEAIELLLQQNIDLKKMLFDFSEPYKIDLEQFMQQNFKFNIPLSQFAKLTGRSMAAFKRDFKKTFNQAPRQWLQQQRLAEAYRLITIEKQKSADIYLDIGFENLSHFYFSFKQKYGVTPSEISKDE